jgi:hypothetical protein
MVEEKIDIGRMLNRPLQRINLNGTWIAPAMQIQHGLFAGHHPETF